MERHNRHETGDASIHKAVRLFIELAADGQDRTLTEIAADSGIPPSTAYRLIQPFLDAGLLAKPKRKTFLLGAKAHALTTQSAAQSLLMTCARAELEKLSKSLSKTTHLGILEEDMVTYLLKVPGPGPAVFTQEGMQLEAYCSGIGKMLLAALPKDKQSAYLANGPFVGLTAHTKTDAKLIADELTEIRQQGWAADREEIALGLACLAVPLPTGSFPVRAAISITDVKDDLERTERHAALIEQARQTATAIAQHMGALSG